MMRFLEKIIFVLLFSGYFVQFKYNATKWWNIFQSYFPDTWIYNNCIYYESGIYDSVGN